MAKKAQSLEQLRKKYSSGAASEMVLDVEETLWLPSGVIAVDHRLGGGIPYGRILEIFGEESSGKSLLAYHFAESTHDLGGQVLWVDAEQAYTQDWASSLGLDNQRVELFDEVAVELISDWIADMVPYYRSQLTNNEPILLVVDSTAALDTQSSLESDQSDSKAEMGNRAKAIYKMLRLRNKMFVQLGVCVIFINQLRKKLDAGMFGDPDCLHYDTTIPLTDGTSKKIGEIVENKLPVKVWSLNEETNQFEAKEVTGWVAKDNWSEDDKWLQIKTNGVGTKNGVNGFKCTPNHKVLTMDNGWQFAKDLKVGDKLVTSSFKCDKSLEDLLLAMSIGDLTISIRSKNTACLKIRDNKNPSYATWKKSLLQHAFKFKTGWDSRGNYIHKSEYSNLLPGIKHKSNRDPLNIWDILKRPEMLAIWYMDDGHLDNKDRVHLCISEKRTDLEELSKVFLNDLGLYSTVKKSGKGIVFRKDDSLKLLEYISDYIVPPMYYKLPLSIAKNKSIGYIEVGTIRKSKVESIILSIEDSGERAYRGNGKIKYDLTVEGNHNFLAGNTNNGVIVHNTTPGGAAMKFFASLRLGITGGKQIKNSKNKRIGRESHMRVIKNKVAPPSDGIKGIPVYFNEKHSDILGFERLYDLPNILLDTGVVTRKKGASRYFLKEEVLANGEDNFLKLLTKDEKLRGKLIRKAGINTLARTQRQLKKLTENLYPVEE